MEIRGERECQDCGARWSYYETGSVTCPSCGSLVSVGVDDRTLHTDTPVEFDLSDERRTVDAEGIAAAADDLKSAAREYVNRRGFVRGGDLLDLDDTYLAAAELVQAVDVLARERSPSDDERLYVLALVRGADSGERPSPGDVPDAMAAARGLAYADAVLTYRGEVTDWLRDRGADEGRRTLGRVVERAKRARALQGDVPPGESETLVAATREVAAYLRDGDEDALARARDRLGRLDD
ncbi:MAG: hypothetical protein ABEJ61_01190 [Haloferacaceae archaeon]